MAGKGLCSEGYTHGDLPVKCKDCGEVICDYDLHRQATGHDVAAQIIWRPCIYCGSKEHDSQMCPGGP